MFGGAVGVERAGVDPARFRIELASLWGCRKWFGKTVDQPEGPVAVVVVGLFGDQFAKVCLRTGDVEVRVGPLSAACIGERRVELGDVQVLPP